MDAGRAAPPPTLTCDPPELRFVVPPGQVRCRRFTLRSSSPSALAFKVKTTSPQRYAVKPVTGVLPPFGAQAIEVTMDKVAGGVEEVDRFLVAAWRQDGGGEETQVKLRCGVECAAGARGVLLINPPELAFARTETPSAVGVVLTALEGRVAFKFQTADPERIAVKPATALLAAGESCAVQVVRCESARGAGEERGPTFAASALKVKVLEIADEDGESPDLAALWQLARTEKAYRNRLWEYRVPCQVEPEPEPEPELTAEQLSLEETAPEYMLGPITRAVMRDPVCTVAGNTYERAAITKWLEEHETDPLTNAQLSNKLLIPNNVLRSQICEWRAGSRTNFR